MYTIKAEDLVEKVYKELKNLILQGILQPGEKLVQESLAERFGVSRTPVQQAIYKLEKELLVTIEPRRGAFVREITLEEIIHIVDIRIRLESLAARNAAASMSDVDMIELDVIMARFKKTVEEDDREGQKEADFAFHRKLLEVSGNPYLIKLLDAVNLISVTNLRGLITDPMISYIGHEQVLEALKSRDPEQAEQGMRNHLENTRQKILNNIQRTMTAELSDVEHSTEEKPIEETTEA